MLGYIAKMWAHYNTMIEGPQQSTILYTESVKCSENNPNYTPIHCERCHCCASQWHPDAMHNKWSNFSRFFCNCLQLGSVLWRLGMGRAHLWGPVPSSVQSIWAFILILFCCFIVHSIGAVHCRHCSPSNIYFRLCDSDMTIDVKTLL